MTFWNVGIGYAPSYENYALFFVALICIDDVAAIKVDCCNTVLLAGLSENCLLRVSLMPYNAKSY